MIFILALFAFAASAAEWPAANFKDCEYYHKADQILECGKKGYDYLPNYGFHYCEEFKKASKNWSAEARNWTQDTGQCLQEMLKDNREKRISPCAQLEDFAFDSHPVCYKQYGICKLTLGDRWRIASTVRAADLISRRSLAQVLNVGLSCWGELFSSEENATFSRVTASTKSYAFDDRLVAAEIFKNAPYATIVARRNYFKRALGLLIGKNRQSPSDKVIDLYSARYGEEKNLLENDRAFFACGKVVASGATANSCDNSVAPIFRNVTRMEAKEINGDLTPQQMKDVVKSLEQWSRMK